MSEAAVPRRAAVSTTTIGALMGSIPGSTHRIRRVAATMQVLLGESDDGARRTMAAEIKNTSVKARRRTALTKNVSAGKLAKEKGPPPHVTSMIDSIQKNQPAQRIKLVCKASLLPSPSFILL